MQIKKRKNTIKTIVTSVLLILFMANCQSQKKKEKDGSEVKSGDAKELQAPQMGASQTQNGEVSDKEVKSFVNVFQKLRPIQQQFQMKASQIIQNSGLGMQKYRQIMQSQQNPAGQSQQQFSQEDMDSFNQVSKELQTVQRDMQTESEKVIQGEGLTPQRYQQIGRISQSDSTLQKKLQNELQTRQQQAPQQPQMPQKPAPQPQQ